MIAPARQRHAVTRRQRGAAALELAAILSVTVLLMLPALALCVFTFYQYSVVKAASDDAAAYLASIPRAAFLTSARRVAARAQAGQMVTNAVTGAGITDNTWVDAPWIWCNGNGAAASCNSVVPASVGVEVNVEIDVMGFDLLDMILPDDAMITHKINYTSRTVTPYVN